VTLDEVLADAFQCLAAGVTDRASPFRTVGVATVAADGTPDVRVLVLRTFDGTARHLTLHTDARSTKYAELRANPAVALLGWDRERRLQLRLRGRASLHSGGGTARAAWEALPQVTRQLYRLHQAPGTRLPDPSPGHYDEAPEAVGFASFVVVGVTFDRLETLRLTDHGLVRARFDFAAGGVDAAWLVP
jgi:hypothetical protein